MGRFDGSFYEPCRDGYPENCGCYTCKTERDGIARARQREGIARARSQSGQSSRSTPSGGGRFEGKEIKVVMGATGLHTRFEFYYGGIMSADGPGHGHVVCKNGEAINFWRKPAMEGGQIVIDDNMSSEQLSKHMF